MSIDNCNGFVYVVQENDSLYGISRRFNISLSWLINANIDNDIYNLFLGKRICIPNRDPYIDIIPIIPIRPWPGNVNGPGPVESDKDVNPYTSGPRFDPRDPRYGTENPFGRIGDADEDDEYTSVVYDEDDEEEDFTSTDLEKVEDVSETESSENGGQMVESTEREDDMWNSGEYDTDYDSDDRANYNQDSSSGVGNFDNVIGPDPRNPRYRQRTGDGTGRINDNDVNIGTRRTNGDMMNDGTGRTNGNRMNGTVDGVT
ncbi:MAG: LysM peptidoglycan-binding domain-containing protein, partial [bacterium]|nr:LysM peptidoglycan-binding domain-containing protein [bacterium]